MNIKLGISSLGLGFIAANSFAGSLSTIYGTNNNGSFGGAVYFDTIIGANDLTVTGFDMNLFNTASTFTLNVYTRSGTYAGATGSTTGWTLVGTGTGTGSAKDLPSHVDLNSTFLLGAGTTTGMALELVDNSNAYTNGTGANQSYSNSDLSLSLGAASNAPFDGAPFSPRVWNGGIYYRASSVPEPASFAVLGLGAIALIRRRRKS
jgi:hypothetical protein